jgi:hypothetical protein
MQLITEEMSREESVKHDHREAIKFSLTSNGETITVDFIDGEPEDNSLSRDFCGVYSIPDLIKMAYEAGKQGQTLEMSENEYSFD